MKKTMFLLPVMAVCVSCAKEADRDRQAPAAGPREFVATVEDVLTRTQLDGDLKVIWGKDDAISVFDEEGNHFQFRSQGTGTSVTFRQVTEGELAGSTFYAVFPYSENNSIDGNVIRTTMNTGAYSASPGSFAKSWHNIMTAKSNGNVLKFRNLAALVKFGIPEGLELGSFEFYATNVIAKEVSIAVDDSGVPSVSSRSTESYGCTVTAGEGAALAAGVYYMPILPGTYKNFRMTMTWVSRAESKSDAFSLDQLVAERNTVINMGTLYDNREHYRWITFENGKIHSSIGNRQDGATLEVIDNPWPHKANSSSKVLKSDASAKTSNIHGGFTVDISSLAPAAKGRIKGVVFQMFVTKDNAGKYYPRLELNDNTRIMPTSINGKTPSGAEWTQTEFNNSINVEGWNTFVYPYDKDAMSLIRIRPMAWFQSGGNVDATAGDRIVYFDNIGFSYVE